MLRILSDLTITSRVDISPASGVTDYVQGQWVTVGGAKSTDAAYIPMGCIFNMTDSDGAIGLSKDVDSVVLNSDQDATIGAAGKLTLITGPFRGVTDQVLDGRSTASAGDGLVVVSGLLHARVTIANATEHVVAVLEEKLTNFEHRGTTYSTAWRFKTV